MLSCWKITLSCLSHNPFLLQCSAQLHQLLSVAFPSDDFVGLEQLIIHYTQLIPLNTKHELGAMKIRSALIDIDGSPRLACTMIFYASD